MTVISYPIPLYANVPIRADFYKPSRYVISAITLGQETLVTTTTDHNYVIGQQVRLLIPPSFGIRELNEQSAYVLDIPNSDEVLLNISSLNMNPFISSSATTKAQILAIGDINNGKSANDDIKDLSTLIPGSFINISPQ
jgi:hypothetical protein